MSNASHDFDRLAEWHGIQPSFYDVYGNLHAAPPESQLAALQGLGVPIERPDQATDLLRDAHQTHAERAVEPVAVIWQGEPFAIELRLADARISRPVHCEIICENGETHRWSTDARPRTEASPRWMSSHAASAAGTGRTSGSDPDHPPDSRPPGHSPTAGNA